ncbi:MAG: membrane protein insertase YidC [Arcanobacterium sp.]|nr:membrane protein insertase YidC [Arcanobacterium sp.]
MDTILYPIMWVISWIMYIVHTALTSIGLTSGAGAAWVLAIVGLTLVVRLLMIPLFNKQMRATRVQQMLAPEAKKIQAKYKGRKDQVSQQRMQQEMMALYRDHGTSPFASCLPVLVQMPIFFSLFRLLYAVRPLAEGTYFNGEVTSIGPINQAVAQQIADSTIFKAPLSSSISTAGAYDFPTNIIVVAVVLIALMIITLFFTQKQIMTKNMPPEAMDPNSPMYKTQRYMLYGMPLIYVFSGAAFQIGVLVYWLTSNFWNIGQQTYMITTHPAPGSPAYKARQERLRKKRIAKGLPPEEDDFLAGEQIGQREQPLGKNRSKKAAAKGAFEETSFTSSEVEENGEVRGKDGLTDAERAQKRYERRMAERQRAQAKKSARSAKQSQNKKQRNF